MSDLLIGNFTKFFIVKDDEKIIGCIGLELFTGRALLKAFAMDPEHECDELGVSLIERLIDEAFEAGSEIIYVCEGALEFFLNIGFISIDLDDVPEEIRKSSIFTEDCPRVAAFMRKKVF